jgi:hypothetical protein
MMFKKSILSIGFAICMLAGCADSYHWTASHPAYNKAPHGSIAVTGIENAFVITRSSWFAKRLEIEKDSIQIKATGHCKKIFENEMRKTYGSLLILPDSVNANSPEESLKLDERIFIKGRIPEQGVSLKDSAGNVPPVILILHEFIIGTDLKRENFFDYALIHNESGGIRKPDNVSAIFSYTLWDNLKQRPLFSAVEEIQQPITTYKLNNLTNLIQMAVQKIHKNLYAGVSK